MSLYNIRVFDNHIFKPMIDTYIYSHLILFLIIPFLIGSLQNFDYVIESVDLHVCNLLFPCLFLQILAKSFISYENKRIKLHKAVLSANNTINRWIENNTS